MRVNTRLGDELQPIEILVIDDSAIARRALKEMIESAPGFRVRTASDPYEAVSVMGRSAPSLILLDVEMPRMDGLTFLRKLMRQHPLPVFLCTDHPGRGLAGLEMGALEVIAKPRWDDAIERDSWSSRLIEQIRDAVARPPLEGPTRTVVEPRFDADTILPRTNYHDSGVPRPPIIALGASTGGVQAIPKLLAEFPRGGPPIVVVQHMPEQFTAAFAARLDLDPSIGIDVIEARHGEPIRPSTVVVVPGHSHGMVQRSEDDYRIALSDGPLVSRHRPSVDVLFRSVAQVAGPNAVGILLTGMGDDGARGLLEIRKAGGLTIAQDEATSVVFGMPREAIRMGGASRILPLHRISSAVISWLSRTMAR